VEGKGRRGGHRQRVERNKNDNAKKFKWAAGQERWKRGNRHRTREVIGGVGRRGVGQNDKMRMIALQEALTRMAVGSRGRNGGKQGRQTFQEKGFDVWGKKS